MPHPSTSQQAPIRGSGTKCRKCGGVILHEWEHCADCDTHLDDQDDGVEMDALGPQRNKAVIRPVALKVKGATPARGTPKAQSAARPAASSRPKLDPSIDLASRFEPEPIKRSFPTGLVAAIAAGALVFVLGIGGAMLLSGSSDETAAAPVATGTATPALAAAAATPTVVAVATPAPAKAAVAAKGKKTKKGASTKVASAKKKKAAHKQVASASSGLPF